MKKTFILKPGEFLNGSSFLCLPHPVLGELLLHPLQDWHLAGQHVELDCLVHEQLLNDLRGWLLVVFHKPKYLSDKQMLKIF